MCDIETINKKISAAIIEYNMLDGVDSIVLGLSGGSDSMALIKFFIDNFTLYSLTKIVVALVNHCLRGKESDRDESFVKEYCDKNDIQCEILRVDVSQKAKNNGRSIEDCARNIRYNFFKEVAKKYNAVIATAHTLSDSIETTFINIARGTGLAGLCGIPAKRENIIRPLIHLKKEDTVNYCNYHNISYVTDSTNLKKDYTRNKLRLDVIPVMKQINPDFEDTVGRMMSLLRGDEQCLDDLANKVLEKSKLTYNEYDLIDVVDQPFSVLSRFVRLAIFNFVKSNVEAKHINLVIKLIKKGEGSIDLPNKLNLRVKNNILTFNNKKGTVIIDDFEIPLHEGEILTQFSGDFIVKILSKDEFSEFLKFNELLFFYALDYDTIKNNSVFRNRRAGDVFCQAKRGVSKTVKKLFNEVKIPIEKRCKRLMLANDHKVLWIDGMGIAESVKVKNSTEKVLLIYSKENEKC